MELHFIRPQWLWCLLPAALLLLFLWRQRAQSSGWHTVIAPELLKHLISERATARQHNLLPLIGIGWLLAALAASGPSWEKIPQPIHQKQDALILILDLSYSMKVADLPPSRIDRARQKLLDLLQLRKEGQTGLIAYAGDAHVVTPLTDDTPTIANLLPALHPDMMPVPGSNPADAVSQGLQLLRSAGIQGGALLLVTDDISEQQANDISKLLRGSGQRFNIMGVGTPTGAPIPLPAGGFLKDKRGTIVMPGLEERTMSALAASNAGRYRRMQVDDNDLAALLTPPPLEGAGQTLALDRTADTWHDSGYLLVLPLLPLVLGLFRRGWLLCLLPLLLLTPPQSASAQNWDDLWLTPDQQGQRALHRGDNETAATLFDNPDWAGTAAYRDGDYETSGQHFSARETPDALYNKGNALAQQGLFDEAIAAYRESLALQPEQADAEDNLRLLEELKAQQEQEQQQQGEQEYSDGEQGEGQQDNPQESDEHESGSDQQRKPEEGASDGEQSAQEPNEQAGESGEETDQEEEDTPESEPQQVEPQPEEAAEQAATQTEAGDRESDQAMEQWLRRVPDDPSGLLREKFRYESRVREEQGNRENNDTVY